MDRRPAAEPTPNAEAMMPGPGAYTVTLTMDVQADDPTDAVEAFLEGVNRFGLRAHVFAAKHLPTGTQLFVTEGFVMTDEDLNAEAQRRAQG